MLHCADSSKLRKPSYQLQFLSLGCACHTKTSAGFIFDTFHIGVSVYK